MLMVHTYSYWHYSHPSRTWGDFRITGCCCSKNCLQRHLWLCPFIPWPPSSRGSWCCGSRGSFTVASGPCSPAFPALHLTCRSQSLGNPVICCVSQLCTGSSLLDHSSVTFSQGGICSSSPHGAHLSFFPGIFSEWAALPWVPTALSPVLLQKHSTQHVHSSCKFYFD